MGPKGGFFREIGLQKLINRNFKHPTVKFSVIFPTMPLPPSLTPEQRQAALEKAAHARRARAELKEQLKMGSITLESLLERSSSDELVGKMKVVSVLESLPGIGKVKARKIMSEVGIADTRRLQGLGANQRERLIKDTAKP